MNFTTIVIAVAAALLMAGLSRIVASVRFKELSHSGEPQLRHLATPYGLAIGAFSLLGIAIWQWTDPSVRKDMDGIALLVATPLVLGLLLSVGSIQAFLYTVTLRSSEIVVRELLGDKSYPLRLLERTDTYENKVTLHFSDGRQLTLYKDLSGYQHFVASLSANNSFKQNPLRGSA